MRMLGFVEIDQRRQAEHVAAVIAHDLAAATG
jgi:hypothetical protein